MNINYKLLVRWIAGLVFASIYGHQLVTVQEVFGLNTLTTGYLISLFMFYLFVYLYQFHELSTQLGDFSASSSYKKQCHVTQWILVALNIGIALYEFMFKTADHSSNKVAYVAFEDFFIIFPEYFVTIIAGLFNKPDHGGSIGS